MFELGKIFSETKYEDNARKMLRVQFGIEWSSQENNLYRVRWNPEHFEPYILVLNIYENNKLIRKEWYEYYSKKWNLVGFLNKSECLELYWNIKYESSFRWYGKDIRDDRDQNQVEKLVRYNLDEYMTGYTRFGLRKV